MLECSGSPSSAAVLAIVGVFCSCLVTIAAHHAALCSRRSVAPTSFEQAQAADAPSAGEPVFPITGRHRFGVSLRQTTGYRWRSRPTRSLPTQTPVQGVCKSGGDGSFGASNSMNEQPTPTSPTVSDGHTKCNARTSFAGQPYAASKRPSSLLPDAPHHRASCKSSEIAACDKSVESAPSRLVEGRHRR